MGISADLMRVISQEVAEQLPENQAFIYDDYYESVSLYDHFPESFKDFIFQREIKLYKTEDLFDGTVYIDSIEYNEKEPIITLSNGDIVKESDIPVEIIKTNSFYAASIAYLGGALSFADNIYTLYNNKDRYPYILLLEEFRTLYNFNEDLISLEYFNSIVANDESKFFIDLNY